MLEIIKDFNNNPYIEKLMNRSSLKCSKTNNIVENILYEVKKYGDKAVTKYTEKFDGIYLEDFLVSQDEKDKALNKVSKQLMEDLIKAKKNIESFHKKQLKESYYMKEDEDILVGQMVNPIERVGIYVPGGKAAYPSTVLMNGIPAKIAGVDKIIMITPPDEKGKIKDSLIAAAHIAGIDSIYKIGGAHGIGALAFGTQTIPKVDKITGPGNIFVSIAKKQLIGYVGIDMIAGPSEIMIIADRKANPKYIAADLISQAEHDEMAASILVTDWEPMAKKVLSELKKQVGSLDRGKIIEKSLNNYGAIIVSNSLEESIEVANKIAPEHLEILTENPSKVYPRIRNAGAIFLGEYSPEPVGDYFAGPNHTLPTNSTARFSSPLSVDDFIKKTSLIYYSKEALKSSKDSIIRIAEEEGLTAHANSIKIRFEEV